MKVVRPNLTSSERLHERLAAARLAVPDQWHFLTEAVIEGAEEVHATLGPGLSRESYAAALRHELALRGLAVEAGREIERWYKGVELPRQRLELVVNGLVAVELASADTDVQLGLARLGAQLFAADAPIGLLINFRCGPIAERCVPEAECRGDRGEGVAARLGSDRDGSFADVACLNAQNTNHSRVPSRWKISSVRR
jgi:GxxExxY protein